jgi:hypothetical protein
VLLLIATNQSLKQGFFRRTGEEGEYLPDILMHVGCYKIPLWYSDGVPHHLIYQPVDFPKVTLNCLAEPGAKTRPLGKNQAWFTIVTRAMRFMAEPILARDGRARIGLRSTNKMWSFLKYLKNRKSKGLFIGQSTDYKSATDLIPISVIKAMWNGFLSSLPRTHPFWVYYELVVCPRNLFVDKQFKDLNLKNDINRRGSFMGEPMSFLTLTLENLLVEEISAYFYNYRNDVQLWDTRLVSRHLQDDRLAGDAICICGDDVAAVRRDVEQIRLFKVVAIALGWQFSWKDAVSRRLLIFCEDHTMMNYRGDITEFRYIDVIKSRLLTTMSRQHSDNRSSILGKGRMLSNQLDYYEHKQLRIAILAYFSLLFSRAYGYESISQCRMPLYLPPSCGGAGIPADQTMPGWMYPYIGYVYQVLEVQDFRERYDLLDSLSRLNNRVKHGSLVKDKLNIVKSEVSRYQINDSNIKNQMSNVVFDDVYIRDMLAREGIEIPCDPYTNGPDFSSLKNEAVQFGFVPFAELSEQAERVLNFQNFLRGVPGKSTRTFNQWARDSKDFWSKTQCLKTKRRVPGNSRLAKFGRSKFSSISELDKAVTRAFTGWIYTGDDRYHPNLLNSGPSLKVSLSSLPADRRSQGRILEGYGYDRGDRAYVPGDHLQDRGGSVSIWDTMKAITFGDSKQRESKFALEADGMSFKAHVDLEPIEIPQVMGAGPLLSRAVFFLKNAFGLSKAAAHVTKSVRQSNLSVSSTEEITPMGQVLINPDDFRFTDLGSVVVEDQQPKAVSKQPEAEARPEIQIESKDQGDPTPENRVSVDIQHPTTLSEKAAGKQPEVINQPEDLEDPVPDQFIRVTLEEYESMTISEMREHFRLRSEALDRD